MDTSGASLETPLPGSSEEGSNSQTALRSVADKAKDLPEAQDQALGGSAHQRGDADRQTVIDALNTAEIVLRILLL